jgi:hypothetical protein
MGGNKSTLLYARLIGETFLYYEFTHYHLPSAVGTDYPVSRDAVSFYIEHDRLAVIPKDEVNLVTEDTVTHCTSSDHMAPENLRKAVRTLENRSRFDHVGLKGVNDDSRDGALSNRK